MSSYRIGERQALRDFLISIIPGIKPSQGRRIVVMTMSARIMVHFNRLAQAGLVLLCTILVAGCSMNRTSSVPSDFHFVMDAWSAESGTADHVNIKINADGKGQYDVYDSGGTIQYDLSDVVIYSPDQVVKDGSFKLSNAELEQLWAVINENKFFELDEKYQMQIGHSYAFILIEADGRKHMVDNIGMEVPEMRAIVDATNAVLPEDAAIEYGEGYIP